MSEHFHDNHMILLNEEQTYLLSHRVCDNGIALCVSGPEIVMLHEHTVTELNGSKLHLTST